MINPTMIEAQYASEHYYISEQGEVLWFRVLGHLCYINITSRELFCSGFGVLASNIEGDMSISTVRKIVEFEIALHEDNL